MQDYDVAIIGGGLLGSSFAWGLAHQGLKTIVFDEGDNAIRTARGNFGLVWVQGKGVGMPEYARFSLESSQAWIGFADSLKQDTGIDLHYQRCGGFSIALNEEEFETQIQTLERLRAESGEYGYDYEKFEHAELKKYIPILGDIPGATFCRHDGHCNPLQLLRALHTGYSAKGGQYKPWNKITNINTSNDGGFELLNEKDELLAVSQKIVVAAGLGSRELGVQVGLDIPIFPDQGQVIVTEKVQPLLNYPTSIVRQTDEGSFLLGASSRDAGFDLKTNTHTLGDISSRCVKAFPVLKSVQIQRAWSALRIMTQDGFPVYQQSERCPGAFSFACHSGATLAAKHALQVTEWIKNGKIPDQYKAFHPGRFHV